jgi:NitT/TauT family transport system substrate-binding protein
MKNRGFTVGLALVAAAVLAVLIWKPFQTKPADNGKALTEVTVAQVGEFFIYLPLYYAEERGFFERNGIKIKLVSSGGDEKSVAAVISGTADFGVGDPTFAAIAKEKGQDVRVIASVVNGVPFWGITKRTDLKPITDPRQLAGLKVATFPKPSTAYVLQEEMFEQGGLKPSIVQAQFGALLPLLETRAVDIVLELEPNVSTAEANGATVLYSMAAAYPDFAITGVTTSGTMIKDRPALAAAFANAMDQAMKAAHSNPSDVVAMAKKRFPNLPPDVVESAVKRMLQSNTFPASAAMSESGWQKAIALRIDSGDLKDRRMSDGVLLHLTHK